MKLPGLVLTLALLLSSTSLFAISLRIENLTPDGWFILIETRSGDKVQVLSNSFIRPWKENLARINAAPGSTIYVSVHKTKDVADNTEHNRERLKLTATEGTKLTITAGTNGEPKVRPL